MERPQRKHTTSSEVRNRWNNAHYDRVNVTVPKGYREVFNSYCLERGTTMNAVLSAVIKFALDAYKAKKNAEA